MTPVVIDTGVLVSGVFWGAESHRVIRAWLRQLIVPVISQAMFEEYRRTLAGVKAEQGFDTDLETWLEPLRTRCLWIEPVPLPHRVCRDPTDDKFIAAALAANARTLMARDPDLTTLEKPFGIAILTPRAWLATLSRADRRRLD